MTLRGMMVCPLSVLVLLKHWFSCSCLQYAFPLTLTLDLYFLCAHSDRPVMGAINHWDSWANEVNITNYSFILLWFYCCFTVAPHSTFCSTVTLLIGDTNTANRWKSAEYFSVNVDECRDFFFYNFPPFTLPFKSLRSVRFLLPNFWTAVYFSVLRSFTKILKLKTSQAVHMCSLH